MSTPRCYFPFSSRYYHGYPFYIRDPLWYIDEYYYDIPLRVEHNRLKREVARLRSRSPSPVSSLRRSASTSRITDDSPVSRATRSAYTIPVAIPVAPCAHPPLSRRDRPNYMPPRASSRSPAPDSPMSYRARSASPVAMGRESPVLVGRSMSRMENERASKQSEQDYKRSVPPPYVHYPADPTEQRELKQGEVVVFDSYNPDSQDKVPYRRTVRGPSPWKLNAKTLETQGADQDASFEIETHDSFRPETNDGVPYRRTVKGPSPWKRDESKVSEKREESKNRMKYDSKITEDDDEDIEVRSYLQNLDAGRSSRRSGFIRDSDNYNKSRPSSSFRDTESPSFKKTSYNYGRDSDTRFASPSMLSLMRPKYMLDPVDDIIRCPPLNYANFDHKRSVDHLKFTMGVY